MIQQTTSIEEFEVLSVTNSFTDKTTQTSKFILNNSAHSNPLKLKRSKTIKSCELTANSDTHQPSSIKIVNTSFDSIRTPSERYSYCQELLSPFLKKLSRDRNVDDDKNKHLDSMSQNRSGHDLCKIIYPGGVENAMSPCCNNDRGISSRNQQEASCSVNSRCPDEPRANESCCCCNNEPPCVERPKCPPRMSECEKKSNICDKTMKEANECELKKCITKCVRDTVKTIKRDQSHCETVIGYIPSKDPSDKTVFYPFNRLKEKGSKDCPLKKSSVQENLESSSEALSNMTGAVGSFICKVYNKTREVVGLAATNSCRHLGLTQEETHAQDKEEESKESCCSRSNRGKKKCSATKCLYESESDTRTEITENVIYESNVGTSTEILEPAKQVIDQISNAVRTSYSSLKGDFTFESLVDIVTFPKPEKSSMYDVPTPPPSPPQIAHVPPPTPPRQFSHDAIAPVHSGMVKSVTNKICSIFRFGKKKNSVSSLDSEINVENIEASKDQRNYGNYDDD